MKKANFEYLQETRSPESRQLCKKFKQLPQFCRQTLLDGIQIDLMARVALPLR